MSIGSTLFKLGFQISPIILTNGIASTIPGGMLPIIAITEAANFVEGLLGGADVLSLDSFFAHFRPLPGSTLQNNQIGKYPFANQSVAANAIITEPLNVSLLMSCPVKPDANYAAKLMTLTALKVTLDSHNAAGGTYIVATPSFIYANCILTGVRDVSGGESKQVQTDWQFDFEAPLISLAAAQQAQNTLMSKLSSGTAISGTPAWSGLASASNVLTNAKSLIGSAISSAVTSPSTVMRLLP